MKKKPRIHRAWAMLFGCCMLQGGSLGMIHNCRGIFYAPIIEDLGFGMGAFTFYVLVFGVFSCFILPFLGKLFSRFPCRLLLGLASAAFALSAIVMGLFHTLPAFYLAGAVQGLAGAFLMFFPAPLILGNWFKEKAGLAIGLSAAFSGVVGVLGNPLGSSIIENYGWRMGYFALGGISLLMMVPVSVFLLRLRPEDCGMKPYGWKEAPQESTTVPEDGVSAKAARRSPFFWLLIAAGLLAANTCCYSAHLSPLGTYAGYGATRAALLVSFSMAGNVLSKVLLGQIYDRRGLTAMLSVGTTVTFVGFSLLLIDRFSVRVLASFLYGFSMAMSAIAIAIAIKDIYGQRGYSELLCYSSMASTLGTSFMVMVVGFIVDGLGPGTGYTVSLVIGAAMTALMGVLLLLSVRGGRRLADAYKTAPKACK